MSPQEGSCVVVTALRLEELLSTSLRSSSTHPGHALGNQRVAHARATGSAAAVVLPLLRLY